MVRFVFFMDQHATSEGNFSRLLHGTIIALLKFEVYCNKSQFHGDLDDVVCDFIFLARANFNPGRLHLPLPDVASHA